MSSNLERHPVNVTIGKGINVPAIEEELKSLWVEEKTEKEDAAIMRARVLNLLVYLNDQEEANSLDDVLAETTTHHPARALVMIADRQAKTPDLQAWVSARCMLRGASKQVCCEQVTFQVKGDLERELPSAINPLLAPDLPVFLWWRAVPDLDDSMFRHLVDMSDRVVIDSAECQNPRRDLVKLSEVFRNRPDWLAISDFNWARLTPWRTLFASFYDVPDYRSYLDRIDQLNIEYVPPECGSNDISPKAVLLASWLASCLGWQLDIEASESDGDDNLFSFKTKSGTVALRFSPAEQASRMKGWVAKATLGAASGKASFSVERTPDGKCLATEVIVEGEKQPSRLIAYSDLTEAQLLSGELSLLNKDQIYEDAVKIAGQIGDVELTQR
ncbi:MAG TPA: glucose-6-phosphate dehydrogenase assembly protein OpcA [Blastocatellia bacterium]|nr:glucose-6-phosphate dehydrogenase assembly protein OpcA [Blastocatellia bacterium]